MNLPARSRDGAALIAAIVIMIILNCVVLGTIHVAMLEQQLARNATDALRLRLAAESAARLSITHWPASADTLATGNSALAAAGTTTEHITYSVSIERVSASLWMARAESSLPLPRHGRASAALLLHAPALPFNLRHPQAGVATTGNARIATGAALATAIACSTAPDVSFRVARNDQVVAADGADFGNVHIVDPALLLLDPAVFAIAADTQVIISDGDMILSDDVEAVLLVRGNLRVAPGAHVRGLIIVLGKFQVDAGAQVDGAIHTNGDMLIGGALHFDPCLVEALLTRTRLNQPRPRPQRAWIPAF